MASRRTPDSSRPSKPAASKPAKASPPETAERPKRVTKPKAPKVAAAPAKTQVSEDTRRAMIAESAYLRAERRGFASGHEDEDWLAAEKEVDALLDANTGGGPQ